LRTYAAENDPRKEAVAETRTIQRRQEYRKAKQVRCTVYGG
jgi:hypothetical protein